MWSRCRALIRRWRRSPRLLPAAEPVPQLRRPDPVRWEYKVVQMVAQAQADAAGASRRLGGALSPEALRSQFPEHYGGGNGRQQINDFLNRLGDDGWELVEFQQIGELPLMVFKRPKQQPDGAEMARSEEAATTTHAGQER